MYAIAKKDLIKIHQSKIVCGFESFRGNQLIFRADRVSNKLIDYCQTEPDILCILGDFQITVFNEASKTVLSICRTIAQVQELLVVHPSFSVDSMPAIVMSNDDTEAGIEVVDVSLKRAGVEKVDLGGRRLKVHSQVWIHGGGIEVIGKFENDSDF